MDQGITRKYNVSFHRYLTVIFLIDWLVPLTPDNTFTKNQTFLIFIAAFMIDGNTID